MRTRLVTLILLGISLAFFTLPAYAQNPTQTSPEGAEGEVTGTLVNRSLGGDIPQSLSVMLHILDQNYSQLGMLHAPTQPDGSFRFEAVPMSPGLLYVGIVAYQGASYYSEPVPYDGKTSPKLEIPIYETTNDLSQVFVEEMHVLFSFADDGVEVSEIFTISNSGDRTVTGTLTLDDGQPATLELPLPADAGYVFFKPDASGRFVELDNSFADKYPLVPGERSSQMMVSYLLPYKEEPSYTYTARLAIKNIDFLVPAGESMVLQGENLSEPEITTLQGQSVYQLYKYGSLPAGQTLSVNLLGEPNVMAANSEEDKLAGLDRSTANWIIGVGGGTLGVAMIAFGIWQWRRSEVDEVDSIEVIDDGPDSFEGICIRIARLDEANERGEIDAADYHAQRTALSEKAREFLNQTQK